MRGQNGYTALTYAACMGSVECVAALLAVDAIDVNVQAGVRHSLVPRIGALRPC